MIQLPKPLAAAIRSCLAGAADLLLPDVCAGCGAQHVAVEGLCTDCNVELLSLVAMGFCPRCGMTLGPNVPGRTDGCGACEATLPRFDRIFRLGPYAGCLRRLIQDLKYRRRQRLRRRMGRLLGQRVAGGLGDFTLDVVIPVPMHWRRRLERGFDHARAIAARLAAELALPLSNELVRTRHTPPQVHLPRSRRLENVRGAFAADAAGALDGANVLLVDDVTTTGATVAEATRTLLTAGAHHVLVAVLAKAEPPVAYAEHLPHKEV
jgi:ComF family protein